MVQDEAPSRKLLSLAACSAQLEKKRGKSQRAVFETGAFCSGRYDPAGL